MALLNHTKRLFYTVLFFIVVRYIVIIGVDMRNTKEISIRTPRLKTHHDHVLKVTHTDNQSLSIDHVFSKWKHMFGCVILTNISHFHCQMTVDINTIHSLLIATAMYFNSINLTIPLLIPSPTQPYQYSYHEFLSLRRQIIIIMSQPHIKSYPQERVFAPYHYIIAFFRKIHQEYIIYRKELNHKWFHLHMTKAGGTTISKTFIKEFGENGLPYYWNTEDPTCNEQYHRLGPKLKAITREAVLFTHNDYFDELNITNPYHGPSLCDKFIYIFPFREPSERICSQASQINRRPLFSLQNVLRTYESYMKIHPNYSMENTSNPLPGLSPKAAECFQKNVTINGKDYRVLLEAVDYQNLYVELLESELDKVYMNDVPQIHSARDVYDRIKNTSVLTENLSSFHVDPCFDYPKPEHRWTPVRHGNVEDSEFIILTRKGMVDMSWHRSASASNIYTTWLGYNYSKKEASDFAMYPTFVPRYKINETHWMNAVDLMMKMDYVMPFRSWTKAQSETISHTHFIWHFLLQQLYDFYNGTVTKSNRTTIRWTKENASNNGGRIYSKDICDNLSENDREMLLKYNNFDNKLYNMSFLIEIADVAFYKSLRAH
eukprot:731850_1